MSQAHKNITLVAIDFKTHDLTRRALEICLDRIDPGEVIVVSDQNILPGSTWVEHEPTESFSEYNLLMMKGIASVVDTSHALYVQYDGMIWDKELWDDRFLDYDYIGAPWPWEPEGRNVGNGGFSLRSKKLLDACTDPAIQLTAARNFIAEDSVIAIDNREYLEKTHGIKFAPTEVANRFSFELGEPRRSWGFHGLWNTLGNLMSYDVDYYMERLDPKNWNIYLWHHVLQVLAIRGYQAHVDSLAQQFNQYGHAHRADLLNWFAREQFPNRDYILIKLSTNG